MTRSVKRVDLQNGSFRVTTTLIEPVCDENDALAAFYRFFETLGADPRLLACDLDLPQKVGITRHADRWQADAVAVTRPVG